MKRSNWLIFAIICIFAIAVIFYIYFSQKIKTAIELRNPTGVHYNEKPVNPSPENNF